MKYPIEIEKQIIEIASIVNSWPVKKEVSEVMNWVLQFDNEDFEIAFRIIKNINVLGPEELNSALAISYSKLMRQAKNKNINLSLKNTMYAAIGGASKSGAMIAYNFRLINELASANFLDDDSIKYIEQGKIENLVLIDDIIGSGDQSAKELQELAERVIPLGVKNIFVLTAVGFKSGIKKVIDTELADVFSALEYDEQDCVISLDSKFYDGLPYSQRKQMQEKLAKYKGLGYNGIGALIAFYYNTPNCTINSIWANSYGWIPLFPRISNVTGIDKHYPGLENAVVNPPEPNESSKLPINSLTIFVEGKTEEIFLEKLGTKFENFGYEKLDVISIGPFYSEKLIASLQNLASNYILITEAEDPNTAHMRRVKDIVKENKLILMDDILTYFDIQRILEDFLGKLPIEDNHPTSEAETRLYLDIKLFKRPSSSIRQGNIEQLVDNFLLIDRAKQLIDKIKEKVN